MFKGMFLAGTGLLVVIGAAYYAVEHEWITKSHIQEAQHQVVETFKETPDGHYSTEIRCENCKMLVNLDIPKGTTVKDYLAANNEEKCTFCDCAITQSSP